MRFLVVHQDHLTVARGIVDAIDAEDVQIVGYHGEKDVSSEFCRQIKESGGTELFLVGVREKFRKRLERQCTDLGCSIAYSFSSLQSAGGTLRDWLAPPVRATEQLLEPRDAFLQAAAQQPRLILAANALDHANELSANRVRFANLAAAALSQYAARVGTPLGDLEEFFKEHQVKLAINGDTRVAYEVFANGKLLFRGATEQHLKRGDHTFRENAARVYFDTIEYGESELVVVLYCGPHPEDDLKSRIDLDLDSISSD